MIRTADCADEDDADKTTSDKNDHGTISREMLEISGKRLALD
jgi:hypothetical protein